jgi:NhaP-type Na+/H+ or K+/H+ antiporter
MVLAAASLDDIISICGFGVSFNVAFSQIDDSQNSSVVLLALNAPISIVGGFVVGFASAYIQFALTQFAVKHMSTGPAREFLLSAIFRATLLLGVSIAVVFLLDLAGFSAGGYLAVMVQACALASYWNDLDTQLQPKDPAFVSVGVAVGGDTTKEEGKIVEVSAASVSALYKTLWSYAQPALFMLIGAEVLFRNISAESFQIAGIILAIATSVRIMVTFLSVSTSATLVTKERLFVCLAWLPKATVQAALGSVVLDAARDMDIDDDSATDDAVEVGEVVLTLAVLAILVTAPIGAVSIFITGPRWLQQKMDTNEGNVEPVEEIEQSAKLVRGDEDELSET